MDPGLALKLGTKRSPSVREHLSAPHTYLVPSLVKTTASILPGVAEGARGWGW